MIRNAVSNRANTFGCKIAPGPQDWQVLQREADGFADIALSGTWALPDPEPGETLEARPEPQVIVRVVTEATNAPPSPTTDWQPARTHPDGTWTTSVRVPAGGLYRLETAIQCGPVEWAIHGDFVHHLGVGDLWVIAGQSNAAGYGRGPVHDPVQLGVHLLRNDETWTVATHPLNDTRNSEHPNLERSNPGHSPFLAFGRRLQRELGLPIGLIQTAKGASSLGVWNPCQHSDAYLYDNLLHCIGLAGGEITGLAWYQGEADTAPEQAINYLSHFGQFIDRLRRDLDRPDLPVLTAQLNRVVTECRSDAEHRAWSTVREAQRQAARVIPGVAVVGTLDLPLCDQVHTSPAGNMLLGERFAEAALGLVYRRDVRYRFPDVQEACASRDRTSIILTFAPVAHRLHWDHPVVGDFVVEDEGGRIGVASVCLGPSDQVVLQLERRMGERAVVHNAFGRDPDVTVYEAVTNRPLLGFYGVAVATGLSAT